MCVYKVNLHIPFTVTSLIHMYFLTSRFSAIVSNMNKIADNFFEENLSK